MKRRNFIYLSSAASIALGMPLYACKNNKTSENISAEEINDFEKMTLALLTVWSDAMIRDQINDPENPELHGALYCHACEKIHGRCMDAVYPFLYMADKTGDKKYLNAAISVMKWSDNVSKPDGSWTVIPDPKSWSGITVFGAIALGEALHHHGHVLPIDIKEQWTTRLKAAAQFIYENFDMEYSHVNYPFTAVYALNFLGRYFKNDDFIAKSKALAAEVPKWLTTPNKLIFGEDKPANKKSEKGLFSVDLGYNVEETLNGLVQYAILEKDEEFLQLLQSSMEGHLAFMLPDGAWDNSWGTRQNKWSYWGSRTCDGCQPAFGLMASRNPVFGTAAVLNTELLQKCTVDGLLSGGLHYESHGILPCIHHTFAHAKSLAFILDNKDQIGNLNKEKAIPRLLADGVEHYPELDVWLAARGAWRATISSYDNVFKKEYSQQATGGSLAVLWHEKVGLLFAASMAEYILVEANNQQLQPGEDFALTPRIERVVEEVIYTNIQDLKAQVLASDENGIIDFKVNTALTNRDKKILADTENYQLNYLFDKDKTTIKAIRNSTKENGDALILPLISPSDEKVVQVSEKRIEVFKKEGLVILEANVPLRIKATSKNRIFNMVPGVEAIPIIAEFIQGQQEIVCILKVQ